MKNKKGIKYYALILVFSSISLVLYVVYLNISDKEIDTDLYYVPVMFTGFLILFDKIQEKIFPKKNKVSHDKFNTYLKSASVAIQKDCDLSIEDYKKLRNDQKFQKGLGQAFRVYDKGESEDVNFEFLERKFKKGTNEYIAFQAVINEVKKMMENS